MGLHKWPGNSSFHVIPEFSVRLPFVTSYYIVVGPLICIILDYAYDEAKNLEYQRWRIYKSISYITDLLV